MNLTQLRYVVEVAKEGNMTRAARSLKTSQPTISSSMQKLEDELGTKLFHRDRRGVTLTASGRKLLTAAQEVFTVLDRTRDEIMDVEEELSGEFTLGCNEALGTYFLPDFMQQLIDTAPGIKLSIWNASSPAVRDAVVNRNIDFGIVVNPEPHPDLVMLRLFRDGIMPFVSMKEEVPKSLECARKRLREGPLIAARRIGPVQEIIARLDAEDSLPARILDCGDLHLVRSLAISGLGVALLPQRVAGIRSGELRPLHHDLPGYPDVISLLFRMDLHRTQAALRLKDELLAYGAKLQAADPTEGSIAVGQDSN